jgi:hypothetical protein
MEYTGKYVSLKEYLKSSSKNEEVLTYEDIEIILNFHLPDSAYVHREWWSNGGHNHSNSWLEAGWMVHQIELQNKIIFKKNTFVKNNFNKNKGNNIDNDKDIIPKPTTEEVRKYLLKWDSLENYVLQEKSLEKLFSETYPKNDVVEDVLIKVCSLNDFYSTKIFSPFKVAKHIVKLNVDKYLQNDNITIVDKIASVNVGAKVKYFYSFATKYCSHHKPAIYPIYDYYVDKMLCYFRNKNKFFQFKNEDLKIFVKFKNILNEFRRYYKLENYNLKEIDRYLWQTGKEYFPRNY